MNSVASSSHPDSLAAANTDCASASRSMLDEFRRNQRRVNAAKRAERRALRQATIENDAWLEARVNERTVQREIARLAGCSERTVRYRMAELNLRKPPLPRLQQPPSVHTSRYSQLNDPDWLRAVAHEPLLVIARIVGCDRQAVRCALARHRIGPSQSAN